MKRKLLQEKVHTNRIAAQAEAKRAEEQRFIAEVKAK